MNTRAVLEATDLPRHEAERLVMVVTGASRTEVVGGVTLDHHVLDRFTALTNRRQAGEPLQYLEGTAAFGPIEVAVDPRVLIPRPETEQLWEKTMNLLPARPITLVDLCTGSGCIALAVKHQRSDLVVIGTDLSSDAVDVGRANARLLGLDVAFREGDLFAALDPSLLGEVGAIVSNPPYVTSEGWRALPPEIRDHEPSMALVADEGGLAFYRRMAADASRWLNTDGLLVAEIGETQADAIVELFGDEGWTTQVDVDLADRPRFLMARPSR